MTVGVFVFVGGCTDGEQVLSMTDLVGGLEGGWGLLWRARGFGC